MKDKNSEIRSIIFKNYLFFLFGGIAGNLIKKKKKVWVLLRLQSFSSLNGWGLIFYNLWENYILKSHNF